MAETFSAESRLIHAGTERVAGQPATPPLAPASIYVMPDSADAADKVVARSRLILPATSFGGVESTWERRARWPGETAPPGLIRLPVGVEPVADLIADIDQALEVL